MLNRTSSSETSSDAEIDLTTLTAEQLETEYGLSRLFDHNPTEERDNLAKQHLHKLISMSFTRQGTDDCADVRNRYIATLTQFRKSEYYLGMQERLNKNQKLTPTEYMIYAMVTENVNTLDPNALRQMSTYHTVQNFTANLNVLIAMRDWQNATDPTIKKELNKAFKQALEKRGSQRRHVEMFLNLHGVNFENEDLSYAELDFTDLGHANFSRANVYLTEIHYSNLDAAKLNDTSCLHPKHGEQSGMTIKLCSARAACFDNMHAHNIDWGRSDFTGSSFKNATIGDGHFTDTIFDNTNFTGGKLKFSGTYTTNACSLKGADFVYGTIVGADYSRLDLTGAKLFIDESFTHPDELYLALYQANNDLLQPIRTLETSTWYKESEITARQTTIASNIVFHISHSSLSDTDKLTMVQSALDNLIFQPEKKMQQLANWAERSIYAVQSVFFSAAPHREAYATPAIKLLEAERDAISARCITTQPTM